ncbi:hypothetical protein NP493_4032g00002 [Ridgeia piscesae]|uniref:Uncharacterized protein n=1 Tax=Ridgeia piscesae TaxID=27915 RepID=A0AAD9MTD5_RIDPI|nr:hypothetical protein NP493_4032g00002 [Ridgeia piscesae]
MSSPPEILSDQKIFHRWQPCPFEYFLIVNVCVQIILMIEHRCRICPGFGWTARLHGISCL